MSSTLNQRPDHPSETYASLAVGLVLTVAMAAMFAFVALIG